MARTGPILIGYDGSPAAAHALQEAADVFRPRAALVVVVWEAGTAFDAALSALSLTLDPAPLDLRGAFEVEEKMYESAQRLAEQGAALARERGLDATGLAVADDESRSVADTLVTLARERDSQAIVVGAHGHSAVSEVLLGRTAHDVVWHAECPVFVVRRPAHFRDDQSPR